MKSAFAKSNILAEQRVESRVVFHRKASLTNGTGAIVSVKVVDISPSGMGLFCADPIQIKQRCTLNVPTFRPELPEIILKGTVIYSILTGMHGFRIGIEFTELESRVKSFIDRIIAAAP